MNSCSNLGDKILLELRPPNTLICAADESKLGFWTLHTPPEVAPIRKKAICARSYFIQLDKLSSFILTKLTKHALAHLF